MPYNILPVHAATFTANLTAVGSQADGMYMLSFMPGGNFTNLQTDDSDASVLYQSYGTWLYNCYDMTTFTASYSTINSVKIYYTTRANDYLHSYAEKPYIRISGTNYEGSLAPGLLNTFQVFSHTWTTNPATGAAWDTAAINAAEYGLAGYNCSTTYFYVVVDYTPESVPSVTTQAVSNVIYSGAHYALLNGTLVSWTGNVTDTYKGFVYGTVSVAVNPGNVGPYASGYTTVSANTTGTGTGAYSTNITGMAAGTTYYVRAYAHNSLGFAYGDEYTFTTLTNPTISLLAATNVASSAARVNSQVTFDGNWSTCNITFGLALVTHAADFSLYTTKINVSGTYSTGQFPYYDLSSLNASATYYYNVRVQNPYGTAYGTESTFTTTSGVNEPTNLQAIPGSSSVSVKWVKSSASSTMIRYSTGTYPTTTAQGTQAYFGTGASCLITGLSEGITYYISAWGYTGGVYSTNYTYTLATTTAFATATQASIPTTANPTGWLQTPDSSGFGTLPFAQIMQNVATAYDFPINSLWYIAWLVAATIVGLVIYNKGNNNLTMAIIGTVVMMFVGVIGGILGFELIAIIIGIIIMIVVIAGRY